MPRTWLSVGGLSGGQHGLRLIARGLFSRNHWLDDEMGELVTILDLLAPHIEEPGYGGYFREEYETEQTVITFENGTYGPAKP
ncbi:hypothetical protein [Streptomyces sp. NPDC058872]|uniref:hypothetical protein n=1 Tax=Streptomyces sp. NPDC058872 TaxID=3346661 RepID=UPI0036876476